MQSWYSISYYAYIQMNLLLSYLPFKLQLSMHNQEIINLLMICRQSWKEFNHSLSNIKLCLCCVSWLTNRTGNMLYVTLHVNLICFHNCLMVSQINYLQQNIHSKILIFLMCVCNIFCVVPWYFNLWCFNKIVYLHILLVILT